LRFASSGLRSLIAALLRIAAAFDGSIVMTHAAAIAWECAFAGFVIVYGRLLIGRPPMWAA
jgi:uncharacterized protein involved in response to NO